ncbi:hypothetical protein ACA910_015529 [Epithemia clementina (nom. ined.)]
MVLLLLTGNVESFCPPSSPSQQPPQGQSTLARSTRKQPLSFVSGPIVVDGTTTTATARRRKRVHPSIGESSWSSSSALNMFMGSDGGILGVGTPEIATILLVGYFVLGPSDLYKLVKEIGKFIQNIRTLGTDLTTSFENNMESQLQLQELRKAQQELNDAFSFRRSINTNPDQTLLDEYKNYNDNDDNEQANASATTSTTTTTTNANAVYEADGVTPKRKRKIRRRVKRSELPQDDDTTTTTNNNYNYNYNPAQLEMPTTATTTERPGKTLMSDPFVTRSEQDEEEYTAQELAQINVDFDKYTLPDLNDDYDYDMKKSNTNTLQPPIDAATSSTLSSSMSSSSMSRFQQQLSGDWNQQILKHDAALSPVAKVMELIALLEQEKIAKDKRLEEEFRKRAENEQAMYEQQRQLLQEAVLQVQQAAFGTSSSSSSSSGGSGSSSTTNDTLANTESTVSVSSNQPNAATK